MQSVKLNHKDTGRFSKIILDYIEGSEKLKPFYKYDFDVASIEQVIEDKKKDNINREVLVDSLLTQNQEYLSGYPSVHKNIKLLKNSNSFTITTGHQLCVFGGPLYFITKVISVIKSTKVLKEKYPKNDFIPVFWLAAEDHGRGEVSSINLFGKNLSWEDDSKMSTGYISSQKLTGILSELQQILGESENAKELLDVFEKAYDGKRNLVDATRYYLTRFFGENGLVLIDGDDNALKNILKPVIKEELVNKIGVKEVSEATSQLEKLGYSGQVYPRDINFFYLGDNGRVGVDENERSIEDVDNDPNKFSPNVIYRPLYQELVLPNLAYIGGPGETAYWFQLKGIFDHFRVNFPMLIVRDNSMFIPSGIKKKMNKLNISIECLFETKQETEKRLLQELSVIDITLEKETSELSLIFEDLKTKVASIDKSLIPAIEGEKVRQLKSFEGLAKRLHKAEKRNQEETLKHLDVIHDKLFPNEKLQERHENFMSLYLQKGKSLFEEYEKAFNPFDKKFTVIIDE